MKRSRSRFRQFFLGTVATSMLTLACGWDPSRPFDRESPEVRDAISHLDGGDAAVARDILEEYLTTGACKEGSIGTPPRVRKLANGSFNLGLALFKVAETFGHPFGEEELDASVQDPSLGTQRGEQIGCALLITRAVTEDSPIELRARAHYLEGNLHFLNGNYEQAVSAYNKALELTPGMDDAGPLGATDSGRAPPDPIGRDAAHNRAIALRRIEDKKDAGQDASNDASQDAANDSDSGEGGAQDSGNEDSGKDSGQNDHKDSGADSGKDSGGNEDKKDAGDEGKDAPSPKPEEDAGSPPPPPRQNQDERMLDQFENAPTVQQEAARQAARERRRVRAMSDK